MKNRTADEKEFFYTDKTSGKQVSFEPVPNRYVYSFTEKDTASILKEKAHSPRVDASRGYRVVEVADPKDTLEVATAAGGAAPLNTLPALKDDEGNERLVVPDEFAVQFAPGVAPAKAEAVLAKMDLAINQRFRTPGFYMVAVPEGYALFQTMRMVSGRDDVEFVEPSEFSTDDRLQSGGGADLVELQYLWGLHNTGQTVDGVAGTKEIDVKALAAWKITRGSPDVVICVLDTGCDMTHADIAPSLLARPAGESWNFVYPAAGDTTDPDGHGTHVCGTAAAAENGGGMVGLAPGCRLMPLQVELMGSTADYQRRADAINFVAQAARTNPGKRYVLNMSWKTAGDVTSIRKAIAGAIETGVVVVAAAGNDDSDMDKNSHYPASYPGLIAVAALDSSGRRASFSNYGSRVDIAAPGVGIYSTVPGQSYAYLQGTSMAAPHVTAAAALICSARPKTTVAEVVRLLRDNATPVEKLNPVYSGKLGGGLLNIAAALSKAETAAYAAKPTGKTLPAGHSEAASSGRAAKIRKSSKPLRAPPRLSGSDVVIADPVDRDGNGSQVLGGDRLTFDGYKLTWHGAKSKSYACFSGPADESARESEKDLGPTPQGKYAIDPANIEKLASSDAWGSFRVRIEPYQATVDRMKTCFKVIRSGMYVHGGNATGSAGCIEINDDAEETDFFERLAKYGQKLELEVRYAGARETKYEDKSCPY
jgi:subtilisin family serine protease